jgi:hypothetical protein
MELEGEFLLTLPQARSTHAPRGRKQDLSDARRIARRLLAGDLTASYVPGPEQREWRLLSRTRVQMLESVVRLLQDQLLGRGEMAAQGIGELLRTGA